MGAIYKGLQFETSLHATWAAFFDLVGWEWHVNPAAVGNWSPDFWIRFPCHHSECTEHTLLAAVLPLNDVADFRNHPCLEHAFGIEDDPQGIHNRVDAGAAFGNSPMVSKWDFAHGAGGGTFEVTYFVDNANEVWEKAKNLVLSQSI